jgi:outer membrane protein OmpA-like peptidoglycan-associated protein
MGGRALQAPVLDAARPRQDDGSRPSPAARLLDSLHRGDDQGVLAACGTSTTVTADIMGWSCTGLDQIEAMLVRARHRFPGLVYESRTRHIGFGLVVDEARVRDATPDTRAELGESDRRDGDVLEVQEVDELADLEASLDHPMYDAPVVSPGAEIQPWRDLGGDGPAAPLNLPVRVTVRHDDLQVHEVTLSFPAALLKRALGMHVDPLEMSLSEVQSAFIAPVGAGFTTHTLARPELALAPPDEPEPEVVTEQPRRRRRRGRRLLLMLLLVSALGAGGWTYAQDHGVPSLPTRASAPSPSPSAVASPTPTPTPTPSSPTADASPSATSTQRPSVTHSAPASTPVRKPNVTLKSDLAFGFNSSQLSPEARNAVAAVAKRVLRAGLTGTIYVDGYTDNLGSAAYGKVLSQRRADAVSSYLQSRLAGADVSIVSVGHGEAHPVASNATSDGRKSNRRVTITLPRS